MSNYLKIMLSTFLILLSGCGHYQEITDNQEEKYESIDCSIESPKPYEMVEPTIPNTGVQRDIPINIILREDFIINLGKSDLWNYLEDKFSENEDYIDTFTFINTEGNIRILGESYLYNITYSFNNILKRKEKKHNLSNIEENQIVQTINLIAKDYVKSEKIFTSLYSSYLEKVENNIMLDNNYNYHAYIIEDGILYEMWGIKDINHPIEECRLDMLEKVTIS